MVSSVRPAVWFQWSAKLSDLQGFFPHLSVDCCCCSGPCSSSHILCLHFVLCPACTFWNGSVSLFAAVLYAFLFLQCFSECLWGQQSELFAFFSSNDFMCSTLLTAPSRFVSTRQDRKLSTQLLLLFHWRPAGKPLWVEGDGCSWVGQEACLSLAPENHELTA